MASIDGGSRKLAAVMFTDIKGFSKKMAENETAAFELLRTHDALMRVIASKFEGKVVKSIGDSFMVDFASVVNAVKAGIDAQKRFWTFNKGKSEFDRIEIRIGIHLGDVMVTGDDMFGDGVNIASRIEAITEPNRICISADVYNQIKKKMDVKVFNMGEMQLKNIPDPVEVYEVLIDTIPELSQPSGTAQQARERRPLVDAEESEADEATSVEAAKKRGSTPIPMLQDTASQVEALYLKAERLYNEGKINEAEQIIEEIGNIDPSYHAAVEKKKEDDEKEKQVHEHYERAGAFIREGKFDQAEEEVKKIFQMFPLHGGAQQLQLQIEDERYRKTEEERQQRLDQDRKTRAEKDQQVDVLTKKTEEQIEKGELVEARASLQKIYSLDPNFTAGERLEEKLRRAEAAKVERERQKAFLDEEKQREELIAQNQERQVEREQTRARHQQEEVQPTRFSTKVLVWSAITIILVIVLYTQYPHLKRSLFPVSASIAVLPLHYSPGGHGEEPLRYVVPQFIAQDLARIERIQVVVPTKNPPASSDFDKVAADFQVRYVLHGSLERSDRGFTVTLSLFDSQHGAELFSDKFDSDYLALNGTRQKIVDAILEATKVEGQPPVPSPLPSNDSAYIFYVSGVYRLSVPQNSSLEEADVDFTKSTEFDSTFGSAYAGRADVRIGHCLLSEYPDGELLREAGDFAQKALRLNPNDPTPYRELAEINFLAHHFDKVNANVQSSLALQPDNPRCYALLAQVALVGGNYELALSNALLAEKISPDDPYIQIVVGTTQQFKGLYADAVNSFRQSITLGFPESFVTARFLMNGWSSQENYLELIQYFEKDLSLHPDDYRTYYWISRAYQMKPSVNDFKSWSDKGTKLLSDYVFKHPDDAKAHAYLGLFLSREGKADDGEAEMNRAITLAPNSTEILFRQADMYAIQKKIPLAVGALKSALARNFDLSEILNPDFAVIKSDPAFMSAIILKTDTE